MKKGRSLLQGITVEKAAIYLEERQLLRTKGEDVWKTSSEALHFVPLALSEKVLQVNRQSRSVEFQW